MFIILFFILKQGFYVYVGLTTPGGRLSVPFLAEYVNVPYWLTVITSKISKLLLELSGYDVYQKHPANITIRGGHGVNLAWGCLGVGPMSLWIAFIVAHRYYKIKYKLKWIIIGIVSIFTLNIFRIVMIALSNYYGWLRIQSFDAHTSFNLLTYCIIIILMLVFIRNYNRRKELKAPGKIKTAE